jgi:hypothetical protein
MVYFQKPGVAEAELEVDIRKSLRMIYYSISGDAPEGIWFVPKPSTAKFLDGLVDPGALPSWLTAEDLDSARVGRRPMPTTKNPARAEECGFVLLLT